MTICADKYLVRDYVSKKIGEKYLVPLIGVYNNENEIDFDKLPQKFVLKTNNNSGRNFICKEIDGIDVPKIKSELKQLLNPEYNKYFYSFEWTYKYIQPKIVCEEYIEQKDGQLFDYKFFCFHGIPKYIVVDTDRFTNHKRNIFDIKWNLLPISLSYPNDPRVIPKPKKLQEMIKIAKLLSKDFHYVRVDMYSIENIVYFGELTFYPGAGLEPFKPVEWDHIFGQWLSIEKMKKSKYCILNKNMPVQPSALSKNKPRIKILLFSHGAQLGGAERSMLDLIRYLQTKNLQILVVLPYAGQIEAELQKNHIPFTIIRYSWWVSKKTSNFADNANSLFEVFSRLKDFKKYDPDLVISNTAVIPWGAITAFLLNKYHIWNVREFLIKDHQLESPIPFKEITELIYKLSDAIWFVSKAVKNEFEQYIPSKKSSVIYSKVAIPQSLTQALVTSPYKSKNSLKLLVAGNFNPNKGQLQAVQAVIRLIDQGSNVEMLLMGGYYDANPYYQNIRSLISAKKYSEKIHIINFTKNPYPYFKLCDIVLVCSKMEAFSRTIIEAGLLNKGVIVSNRGGNLEAVVEGKNGYIYTYNDIEDLVNKIRIFITNPPLIKTIGKSNKKIADELFIKDSNLNTALNKVLTKLNTKRSFSQTKLHLFHIFDYFSSYLSTNEHFIEQTSQLKEIQSSKFYKVWSWYCKIKQILHIGVK